MAERITAKRSRAMLGIFENLFAFGTERLDLFESGVQIIHVQIEVHRGPMAIVRAAIFGVG